MKNYKNPALSDVNGVLTAHCIACGQYIGNEHDSNFYSLIRRKYCIKCAQVYDTISKEKGRKNYREKTKRTMKSMGACIDQYEKQARILKSYIVMLENKIDDMERKMLR